MDLENLTEEYDQDILAALLEARQQIEQFILDIPKGTANPEEMGHFITLVLAQNKLQQEAINRGLIKSQWPKGGQSNDDEG